METVDFEMFNRIAAVNMNSIYFGAMALVPLFKEQGAGCVPQHRLDRGRVTAA